MRALSCIVLIPINITIRATDASHAQFNGPAVLVDIAWIGWELGRVGYIVNGVEWMGWRLDNNINLYINYAVDFKSLY